MRIYISSHDPDRAESLALDLTEDGHEVVSTWHRDGNPPLPPSDSTGWASRAAANFDLIRQANALVLIGGTERVPGGKYVEAGYAHGCGIPVFNLGDVGNGMMNFSTHAADVPWLLFTLQTHDRTQ